MQTINRCKHLIHFYGYTKSTDANIDIEFLYSLRMVYQTRFLNDDLFHMPLCMVHDTCMLTFVVHAQLILRFFAPSSTARFLKNIVLWLTSFAHLA